MAREKFFKLGKTASMFYDPKNQLKITNGVPGKTSNITKTTKEASRSGHIIEITEVDFNGMMGKLPLATKAAIEKEQKLSIKAKAPAEVKGKEKDEEEEDSKENSEERQDLLNRLGKLGLKRKELARVSEYTDEALVEYLEKNED